MALKKKDEVLQIKINSEDKKYLKIAADKQGVTLSVFVLSVAMNKAKRVLK